MARPWSTCFLPFSFLFLSGILDITAAIQADSPTSKSSFHLRDAGTILAAVAIILWGIIVLFLLVMLLYILMRCCNTKCGKPSAADDEEDEKDSGHLLSGQTYSDNGGNKVSTYYVYIESPRRPADSNTTHKTSNISVQTYGAI